MPEKMIKTRTRSSMLLDEQSSTDPAMKWRFRLIGAALVVGGLFFLAVIWALANTGPH
jgi:hypothetical protein